MADTSENPRRLPFWDRLRIPFRRRAETGTPATPTDTADTAAVAPRSRARLFRTVVFAVLAIVVLWYPIGMALIHEVDDDLNFGTTELVVPTNGSRAVAIAAALLQREVVDGHWTANDPFFMPGSALDNMPAFQQGIVQALARFGFELTDQIGRVRGSSRTDPDLQEAAGLLQYSGNKWIFDFSTSLAPTATSEAQYTRARRALIDYNQRLSQGQAVFERRADNLQATLDRIALDIGSSSATLDQAVANPHGWFDMRADDIFYGVKGQMYAYYLILRELQKDFANVIVERDLQGAYAQLLDSMAHAAGLSPWVVVNGAPDAQFEASHLASEGFYLMRSRTQLREITTILQK
ncbi:MAG: DUF2333 family protein [Alphaproteobacteria bacterium]|nr:DUF2333 family protein [Alphaproteobacteria bacterium]